MIGYVALVLAVFAALAIYFVAKKDIAEWIKRSLHPQETEAPQSAVKAEKEFGSLA